MSDLPQGAGWWKASNGKWYSPKYRPRPPRLKVAKSFVALAVLYGTGAIALGFWVRGEYDERTSSLHRQREASWTALAS